MRQDTDSQDEDPDEAIRRGWIAFWASRYREAESQFRGLLGSRTDAVEAVCGLSAVLRARGRPAEAALLIKRAQRDHAGDPSLDRELGYVVYQQGRFDDAARIFASLIKTGTDSVIDRRWQVASLRMARRYEHAEEKLDEARMICDHPDFDLERGWLAYFQQEYEDAAELFRAAGANGAEPEVFVPPLVSVLLGLDRVDAAEEVVADAPRTSPIVAARADIQVQRGTPGSAIKLLREIEPQLDEDGLVHLVALLHGAERDDEAQGVFDTWLDERSGEGGDAIAFASPSIVATWIELSGRRPDLDPGELRHQVLSALARYDGPDPVPAVVAASAVSTMRQVSKADAMKIAQENIERNPGAADLRVEAAKTSFSCHDYQKAIWELELVIMWRPHDERAHLWRCRSMRRLGQWSELEYYLGKKISEIKQSPRLLTELGRLRLAQDRYLEADEAFREAARLDRSSQQALFGRVTALRKMQLRQETENLLEDWRAQWPDSSRRRLAEAMFALERGNYDFSAGLFQKVGGVPGMLGQASVLMQQRRPDEARAMLEDAVKTGPDRSEPKIALAIFLAQGDNNDRKRASQLCEAVRGWGAESDAAAFSCRAQLAISEGYLLAAESLLELAMQLDPYGAYSAPRASALMEMYRVDEAVDLLKERLETDRHDSAAHFQLYRALHTRGDAKGALAALRAAFSLATGPERARMGIIFAYELDEQGSSIEADQVLRRLLAEHGAGKDLLLRLGRAWVLLSRGERAQTPALLQEAINEVNKLLAHSDLPLVTEDPEHVKQEALKCRGTAYLRLAEYERSPRERARLAALARSDQGKQQRMAYVPAPRGSRWAAFRAAGFDTGLRMAILLTAVTLTIVLWVLHNGNQEVWTTTIVLSLTPVLLAIILLAALLPELQTLRLAGLEARTREAMPDELAGLVAQTREMPPVPLPTSPSVALREITEFTMAASENFLGAVDVSDLIGTYSTAHRPLVQQRALSYRVE